MDAANWNKLKVLFNRAIDLPVAERASFLENYDENLRNRLNSLIAAHESAGEFIAEPALVEIGLTEDANIGRRIDDYEILQEIGRGGMGAVYLAKHLNDSFTQTVAVKLIKRGMDTEAVLKRFVMERQILANLEHPNIARLLDVGTTTDGLPYFVMEYIEGLPVTKFCDESDFTVEERLKLFRRICAAVSYAHQNLVVHRDIKPSNILVTKDGTPKLLDFGIAKLLNPDWLIDTAEATATMMRLLTPEYASPEQIRGGGITTASDVYSLGVVLYELLSGQRPFFIETESREEFIQAILSEEPLRPSSVARRPWSVEQNETAEPKKQRTTDDERRTNPKSGSQNPKLLKGDLDNIILKSLRKEPERRYASAQEFSEDIRRHLAGLPVTATADTKTYRFRKFITRHRVGVFTAFLMALTLLAATTITAWQAFVARREQAKAEMRFNQVRKLANTVLFEYHDGIANLPGSTPVREKLVKDSLEYLNNLSAENDDNPDLQKEIATAYQKIGDVQGSPWQGNLGNIKDALESYRKSLAIREKLYTADPNDAEAQRALAKIRDAIANIYFKKGDYVESNANYRESLRMYEELSNRATATIEDTFGLAQATHRIGFALSRQGDSANALAHFQNGLAKYEEITRLAPDVKKYQNGKAIAHLKIGDILVENGDLSDGLENHRRALEIFSAAAASEPHNALYKNNTAIVIGRIAEDLEKLKDYEGALAYAEQLVAVQREIAAADPKDLKSASALGSAYVILGSVQGKMKNFAHAQENMRKGLQILREIAGKTPDDAVVRRDLGLAYFNAGNVFADGGKAAEAVESYRQAVLILDVEPLRGEALSIAAKSYERCADAMMTLPEKESFKKKAHLSEAGNLYRKSLAAWSELQQKDSPKFKDAGKLDELKRKISDSDAALAKL